MKVGDRHYRSIWYEAGEVRIIDQRWLPHEFRVVSLVSEEDFVCAIRDMWVRGAPLIGASQVFSFVLSLTAKAQPLGENRCWRSIAQTAA